jgi:hypothetical protein
MAFLCGLSYKNFQELGNFMRDEFVSSSNINDLLARELVNSLAF